MASPGNLTSAKSEQLFKLLLVRNSINQAAIKKFIKRIQQRDKLVKSIQQLKQHQHNKYGINLPSIFKRTQKISISTDPDTESYIKSKQGKSAKSHKFLMRDRAQIDIKKKTHTDTYRINNSDMVINRSLQNQFRKSYIMREDIVISQTNQLCKLRIHKRNLNLEGLKQQNQEKSQIKDDCQSQLASIASLTNKTPLNLNNIVFQNQTEKIILNQSVQKHRKRYKKNQMKHFILSSSNVNSQVLHKTAIRNKQNENLCMNLIKKEAILMKSISNSLDRLLYPSIFKSSSDVRQVMMKVNAITIKQKN